MTGAEAPAHIRKVDLDLLDIKVTRDGGEVRYLEGARHGLKTSVFQSTVRPGSGPPAHTHAYAEIFVVHEGVGRYVAGDQSFDAEVGDVVVIPPEVVHSFSNPGATVLRHTAIHEAPVQAATPVDPSTAL